MRAIRSLPPLFLVLILLAAAAVGLYVILNLKPLGGGVLGADVLIHYKNGEVKAIKPQTQLSIFQPFGMTVTDIGTGLAIDYYEIKPWVIVSYTGKADSWTVTGSTTVTLYGYGDKTTLPLVASTVVPTSDTKFYLNSQAVTANSIESWTPMDNTYTMKILTQPTITLTSATVTTTPRTAAASVDITFRVTGKQTGSTLSIVDLKVGVEVVPMDYWI